MTLENDDQLGLYMPDMATYRVLATMVQVSTIEENPEGSALAESLLYLPDVFTQATAAVLLDSVSFNTTPEDYQTDVGTTFRDVIVDRYNTLAEQDAEDKKQPDIDTGILEEVLALAEEDLEAAKAFYQSTNELRRELQRQLGEVEKIRLLLSELQRNSSEVTVGQLQLVEDRQTSEAAARAFPAAEDLLSALQEEELTPAEQRRLDRQHRVNAERTAGAGNRGLTEASDLEIMIMMDEDPVAITSMALNSRNVDNDQLIDLLEDATNEQLFYWMFGMESQWPQRGNIEELMSRFTDERIRELAAVCKERLDKFQEANNEALPAVPWITDIIRHVYIPRVQLDTASAALVWHDFSDTCGDDPSMWLAVLLADTGDTPTRLQDVV